MRSPCLRHPIIWFLVALHLVCGCCDASAEYPAGRVDIDPGATEEAQRHSAIADLPAPRSRPEGFRRGVSLGLFVSTEDAEARRTWYRTFLQEIKAIGATDVSLVVRWSQADIRASAIGPKPGVSVEDAVLLEVIEVARAEGLRVFLLPILHLEQMGKGEWRGRLKPGDRDAWWASYARFILHYAALGQRSGVDLLSVGSEMATMESEQARWRALIKSVRGVFEGELTYSANWDHFEPLQFWDALDVVGVTAYQELSKSRDPDEDDLVEGWKPFLHRLRVWARQHDHRYIFTEVGYPSNQYGAARPWDHRVRGVPDLSLQLRCYRAMHRVWHDDGRLDGLYVWNWFGAGGEEDRGYSPRGKPSRFVLEHWYRESVPPRNER